MSPIELEFIDAAQDGDLEKIQNLLAQGVNINAQDYNGRTALQMSAKNNQLECLAYLIANDADLHIPDNWKQTPLHWATNGGSLECVIHLIKCGADFMMRDNKQMTPLGAAKMFEHYDIVEFIEAIMECENLAANIDADQQITGLEF